MKRISSVIFLILIMAGLANATVTVNNIPKIKTGGTTPVIQNSSLSDNGTTVSTSESYSGAGTGLTGTAAGLTVGAVSGQTFPGSGLIVGTTDTQTLTNKTIGQSEITNLVASGKTLTANNSLTLAGTDSTTITFPSTSATIARTDAANTFTGHQTIEGVTSTGATGTGNLVFSTSPSFTTPVLGTPASGVATNLTGTASGLTAGTVTTNANLTGPVTSSGNATAITSQGIQSSGINWNNINGLAPINTGGINWNNTNGTATINSSGINWQNITVVSPINTKGTNWETGPGNTAGYIWTDTGTSGNWQAAPSGGTSQWTGTSPIYYNGNVGINSTLPGTSLDVQGTVRALGINLPNPTNNYVLTTDASGNGTWQAASGGGSGTVSSGTVGNEAVYTGSTTVGSGIITDTGTNIGINSVTPGQRLDVQGTIRVLGSGSNLNVLNMTIASGGITKINNNSAVTMNDSTWELNNGGSTVNYGNNSGSSGSSTSYFGGEGTSAVANINSEIAGNGSTASGGAVQIRTGANTVAMRFQDNGNIGIGSSTPGSNLDVQGTVRFLGGFNVGINTSSPGSQLDVQGTIRSLGNFSNLYYPGVETFSNATSITPTGNFEISYMANTGGAGTFTVNAPTNTYFNGQRWVLKLSSTAIQTFSWNTIYNGGAITLPISTLGTSTLQYFFFMYDSVNSKWDYMGNVGGF